jgi:hypothetical protein
MSANFVSKVAIWGPEQPLVKPRSSDPASRAPPRTHMPHPDPHLKIILNRQPVNSS